MFDGFATSVIDVGETSALVRRKGSGLTASRIEPSVATAWKT